MVYQILKRVVNNSCIMLSREKGSPDGGGGEALPDLRRDSRSKMVEGFSDNRERYSGKIERELLIYMLYMTVG